MAAVATVEAAVALTPPMAAEVAAASPAAAGAVWTVAGVQCPAIARPTGLGFPATGMGLESTATRPAATITATTTVAVIVG